MGGRLFLKIYLTVLGSIVILAVTGFAAVALLVGSGEDRSFHTERAALFAAALPDGADPAALQTILERLGAASGAELTVHNGDGAVIARHEPATPVARRFDAVTVPLAGERSLTVRVQPPFGPRRGNPLILLVV